MKKNKKFYLKTNIISFIIGGILVSGFGVYAAVTFPSNDVSYDNSSSGLSSTNVKGAIDELYKTCTQTPADQIIEAGGLEKDPYECRYFFTGANPNNYITFNGETAGWRIISAECDGTIKIIKNDSIGNQAWDSSNSNNWERPASLNTYLNETYLNNTLNSTARNQIVTHNWNIGPMSNNPKDLATQISYESQETWSGKIALPTLSEYFRTNSNTTNCGTLNVYNTNYQSCVNSTWMDNSNTTWWTLSDTYGNSIYIYYIPNNSSLHRINVNNSAGVRPVVYLSSDLRLSGSGTQSDPYTIN